MNALRKICLSFFLMLILLGSIALFLLGTSIGLHLMLKVSTLWIPGLKFSSISGNFKNMIITKLYYQTLGITLSIDELHLNINLNFFKKFKVYIDNLSIHNISIEMKDKKLDQFFSSIEKKYRSISTPYPLILRHLSLHDMILRINDTTMILNKLNSGIVFQENQLIFTPSHIIGLLVIFPKENQIKKIENISTFQKCINFAKKNILTYSTVSLEKNFFKFFSKPWISLLPVFDLPINLAIKEIIGENIRLIWDKDILITKLNIQAEMYNQNVKLTRLDVNFPQILFKAHGKIKMCDQWPINLVIRTTSNNSLLKKEKIQLIMNGNLLNKLHASLDFHGPIDAKVTLNTKLSRKGFPMTIILNSSSIQWPLNGIERYSAKKITIKIKGKSNNYRIMLQAIINKNNLPLINVFLKGKGNTNEFNLSKLKITMLKSYINLSAKVNWNRSIKWHSELILHNINIVRQWLIWPMRLSGKIIAFGHLNKKHLQFQIPVLDLNGNIKEKILSIKGSLKNNSIGQWKIPKLQVSLGSNILIIRGYLKEKLLLNINLNVIELHDALSDFGGNIQGNIKLCGNFHSPEVIGKINARALYWKNWTISCFFLKKGICYSKIIHNQTFFNVDKIKQKTLFIHQLILNATGNEKKHQLQCILKNKNNKIDGQLNLNGNFNRLHQRWCGILSKIRFTFPLVGEWWITKNVMLDYQVLKKKIIIGPHCWRNVNANICVSHNIEVGTSGKISLLLNHFNLSIVKPFIPKNFQVSGILTGHASVNWFSDNDLPQGKIFLEGNKININYIQKGELLPIKLNTFIFNVKLNKNFAHFNWFIKIFENGRLHGQIKIIDIRNKRNIFGNVNIKQMSLKLIKPFFYFNENINGLLNSELHFEGNIKQPKIYGQLQLKNFIINKTSMPFIMTDSYIFLDFYGTKANLKGLIKTTKGQMNLFGNINWNYMQSWYARIVSFGNRIRLNVPSIAKLDISPNIIFNVSPRLISLNGKVNIPWARINVKDLSKNVIEISPDEIMLDSQLKPVFHSMKNSNINIKTNLFVHIGNDVHINAFGLKSKLQGDLKVIKDKKRLTLNGQIGIFSGRFQSYGQDFIVNKGQLIFSGPVDNPYLNIKAIRNSSITEDKITTGIHVTGSIDQPKIKVFSNLTTSHQEELSYLLSREKLNNLNTDRNIATSLLIKMGVAKSEQLINKIGKICGISDLILDTQGIGDNSKVVVSGYVFPNLQIKYGVGIFDALATLTLRYRLIQQLYLEAISDRHQTLNLIYLFEF